MPGCRARPGSDLDSAGPVRPASLRQSIAGPASAASAASDELTRDWGHIGITRDKQGHMWDTNAQ